MTEKISLLNKKKAKLIAQTMSLLSKTSSPLIEALVQYVVYKIKASDIPEFKHSAIYRAKSTFNENREKVITLSGLYSPLYGREKSSPEQEPFSLIVNVDDTELKQGYIWYSTTAEKSFQMDDLDYFVLTDTGYAPFTHIGHSGKRTRK
ncbi:hypothetical protein MNZ66_004649 [Salmonella enterica]|nr:hypothetical protein [Salmonella enterica]